MLLAWQIDKRYLVKDTLQGKIIQNCSFGIRDLDFKYYQPKIKKTNPFATDPQENDFKNLMTSKFT